MESKIKRNVSLDLLKILSCFSVVILHIFGKKPNVYNSSLYYIATFAIPVFFMVNGFLLMKKEKIDYNYIFRKILKILLIVVSWNIILTIAIFIFKREFQNPIIEAGKNLVQSGTFYQFWFFGTLIIIYSILPVLHKVLNKNKTTYKIILTILFSICIIVDIINIILGLMDKKIFTEQIIQTFRLWTWLFYFLLGGYIGKYNLELNICKNKKYIIILILTMFIIVMYQYIIGNLVFKNFHAEYFYDNILIMFYVLVIWNGIYNNSKFSKYESIIEKMNKYIIGVYILHLLIIGAISKFYQYDNFLINIIMLIFVLLLSIIVSAIIDKIPKIKEIIKM